MNEQEKQPHYSLEELETMVNNLWGWGIKRIDPAVDFPWAIDPDSPEAMVTGGGGHSDPLTGAWIPDAAALAPPDQISDDAPTPTPPPGVPAYDAWGNPYGSSLYTVALDAPFDPDNGA